MKTLPQIRLPLLLVLSWLGATSSIWAQSPDSFNPVASGQVSSIAVQANSKILVGGNFTTLGGQTRNRLARLDTDGTLDAGFNPGANGEVVSLAVQMDGKILVGGNFTTLGGQTRNRLARLNADGTLDIGFNPGASSTVSNLVVQTDGKILVGGNFTTLGGQTRNRIARLNADGTLDAGFNPGANGRIYSIAVQADGKILVGGEFTTLGGQARERIARLNADGTLDDSFNPGASSRVNALAVQRDGKILTGGSFTAIGGNTRNRIARLNADGSLNEDFNPGADSFVYSLIIQADGKILAGGEFTILGGQTRNHIARLNADGSLDTGFNPDASGTIYSLAVQADGRVLTGGNFTTLNGQARERLGRLTNNTPAIQTLSITGTDQIDWQRSGSTPEVEQVTFAVWNGNTWVDQGTPERVDGGWRATGLNLLTNTWVLARGRSTGGYGNGSSGLIAQVHAYGASPLLNISDIPDQTLYLNTVTNALGFTIGIPDILAEQMMLSGSSSNTALVPDENILFGGSGASRTVTVIPAIGQSGSAVITVQVSDGSHISTTTFNIEVLKFPAVVTLGHLRHIPDGSPKPVTVTTNPPGLNVAVTYNGASTPPSTPGEYAVLAAVNDPFYAGSATGTLVLDRWLDRAVLKPEDELGLPAPMEDITWEAAAAGLYEGLLRDAEDGHRLLGAIETLRVSSPRPGKLEGGAVSGKLRLPGLSLTLTGRFDVDGTLHRNLPQKGGSAVTLALRLQRTPSGHKVITGTVSWKGLTTNVYLPQVASALVRLARQGRYTLLLPSQAGWGMDEPGGDGWGVVTISPTGVVKVKGRLGDGTPFVETAHLSGEGEFCLYQELYRTKPEKGRIGGRVVLRDVPGVSDFDGRLQWVKLPDNKEKQYADGFTVEVWALGSRFTEPPNGQRLLAELVDAEPNAVLNLIGPNLLAAAEEEIERVISWQANNTLRHYGPEALSGRSNRGTGQVTGSYSDPASRLRLSFQGAVFQKQGLAAGWFITGGGSGALRIKPGTDFPYPGGEYAGVAALVETPGGEAAAPALTTRTFERAAAGVYGGVLRSEGTTTGGIENLKITHNGGFSGTVWILGFRYRFSGVLDINGAGSGLIQRSGGLPPLPFTLQLHLANGTTDGYQLTGTITVSGVDHVVDTQRLPAYSKSARAPQEGAYTLALLAPEGADTAAEPGGDSYAILKVSHLARCTGALVLADGTKTTFAGHVSRNGEWSLHRGLYGNPARGYLAGKVTFRNVPGVSDLDGAWRWLKQSGASPKSPAYPGGFTVSRKVAGSKYAAPGKGARAWAGLDDAFYNAWLRLAGPDLSPLPLATISELDRVVTWNTANRILYYGPDNLTVKVNTKTGLVTGRYRNAPQKINQNFGGILLQKQALITGSYTTPWSGRFWMQAR